MSNLEPILLNALNEFCFDKIWNEPESELRANIVPRLLQERSVNGTILFQGRQYDLPTLTDPYFVYAIPNTLMYTYLARSVPDTWLSCTELCNDYNMLMRVYHLTGKMMAFSKTFIRRADDQYLLAIAKSTASKAVPYTEMKNIRLTMYFDSDKNDKVTIGSFTIPSQDDSYIVRRRIQEFIQSCPHDKNHTTLYVNGYETEFKGLDAIPLNSFVDVIHDENELLSFTVDLTDLTKNVTFLSERDNLLKLIVHTPKELNPDNIVYTHNTADIHVRVMNSDGTMGKGLYLHRCATRSVDQITHNDISIPVYILDDFRDYLETQEIAIRVVYRKHDKDNILIRDKNYIDLLYTCDDATIVQHLLGRVSDKLDFWKASNLEKSEYVRMMFDVPNIITASNMWQYVESLGYYHTMALLCKKVIHSDITAYFDGSLRFTKPYLFGGVSVYPVCYKNGKKIREDQVTSIDVGTYEVEIGFDEVVGFTAGDKLTVEFFVDGINTCYKISPTAEASSIILPYSDFIVLEEFTITDPVKGIDVVSDKSYRELTEYVGDIVKFSDTTGVRLVFGPRMYGRSFILQNRFCVYHGENYIDSDIIAGNPIVELLNVGVRDGGYTVPIWNDAHTKVYLNGKYLIEGIDYTVQEFKDISLRTSIKQLIIQNLEYFDTSNNYLEWIVTSANEENMVEGYTVNNMAASESELALLFPEMTMMHVDGLYEEAPTDRGNYIELPEDKYRDGAPFEIATTVPYVIHAFLSNYHPNDDLARLEILNEYFYGKQPVYPDIIVMPHSHRCFSPYTVMIIRDIVNGTLKGIGLDPDLERMRTQFSSYDYAAACCLVMQRKYDLNFVDTFPHYKQIVVPDPNTYRLLQAFINSVMPEDDVTSGELFYG